MVNLDKNFLKLLFRFTTETSWTDYMMAKTDRWYIPTGYLICFSTKFLVGISKELLTRYIFTSISYVGTYNSKPLWTSKID